MQDSDEEASDRRYSPHGVGYDRNEDAARLRERPRDPGHYECRVQVPYCSISAVVGVTMLLQPAQELFTHTVVKWK